MRADGLRHHPLVERDPLPAAAALGGVAGAGALHQDLAHRQRGNGDEVGAVLELARPLGRQLEEGFVDERRGLESLAGPLAADVARGDAAQLVVDERQQRGLGPDAFAHGAVRTVTYRMMVMRPSTWGATRFLDET